jgi:hypothetical protein
MKKIEHAEAILTEETMTVLNIPFQRLKEEQLKHLETFRYSNKYVIFVFFIS